MQPNIVLSAIAAMTSDRVIGRDNDLPWHIPSDLVRFEKITKEAGIMLMGRKTHESILARTKGATLAGRHHIVLSKTCSFQSSDSITSVGSLEEACAAVVALGGRACVIGGEQIYTLFLP